MAANLYHLTNRSRPSQRPRLRSDAAILLYKDAKKDGKDVTFVIALAAPLNSELFEDHCRPYTLRGWKPFYDETEGVRCSYWDHEDPEHSFLLTLIDEFKGDLRLNMLGAVGSRKLAYIPLEKAAAL